VLVMMLEVKREAMAFSCLLVEDCEDRCEEVVPSELFLVKGGVLVFVLDCCAGTKECETRSNSDAQGASDLLRIVITAPSIFPLSRRSLEFVSRSRP
jgi:hypothetical protein